LNQNLVTGSGCRKNPRDEKTRRAKSYSPASRAGEDDLRLPEEHWQSAARGRGKWEHHALETLELHDRQKNQCFMFIDLCMPRPNKIREQLRHTRNAILSAEWGHKSLSSARHPTIPRLNRDGRRGAALQSILRMVQTTRLGPLFGVW